MKGDYIKGVKEMKATFKKERHCTNSGWPIYLRAYEEPH